jgi:signal peptidase
VTTFTTPRETVPRARRRGVADVITTLLGIVGVLAVLATLAGVRLVPVLTGSMAPGIPAGSLVLTTHQAAADVRPGQVVAFRPPSAYTARENGRLVMHRIVSVTQTPTGLQTVTRGDANTSRDPWTLSLSPDAALGRERVSVPHLGRIVAGGPLAAACLLLGLAALGLAASRITRRAPPEGCSCSTDS